MNDTSIGESATCFGDLDALHAEFANELQQGMHAVTVNAHTRLDAVTTRLDALERRLIGALERAGKISEVRRTVMDLRHQLNNVRRDVLFAESLHHDVASS